MRGIQSSIVRSRGSGRGTARKRRPALRGLVLCATTVFLLGMLPAGSALASCPGPGCWTQAQVNTAIDNGVAYLATQQNADGSFGSDDPAETGIALAAFGVEANGNFSSLSPAYQTDVKNAISYLLANQDTTHGGPPDYFGSWNSFGGYDTYSTGLALLGLAPFTTVNPGVPAAIANGRTFLAGPDFEGPANTGCDSSDGSPTSNYCGGWNYDAGYGRSDQSNSGYALTGLEVTGGIPAAIVPDNINWQHHVQEITGNPFAQRNDGGADYQPGGGGFCDSSDVGGFCSNANNSGSNLFGYADDGVAAADPHVAASIKFDQDVLNSYELMKANAGPSGLAMIAHSGATEDGSCTPDAGGCDWSTSGDGGFHYSMFALTKGLGSYIPSNLSTATNWYAIVADLLLSQQASDGSWPQDARDDFSTVFATGLSVSSLGKVAVRPTSCTMVGSGTTSSGGNTLHAENSLNTDTTQTETLVLRSTSGPSMFFRLSGLTSGACRDNTQFPPEETGTPLNFFNGTGTGSFGTSSGTTTPGYTITLEIGDLGDSATGDTTTKDAVSWTITDHTGHVVWKGRGNLTTGSEEISG